MDRLACVDLPALPLQLLLRAHPEWRGVPAVVVDEDSPRGVVLWASPEADAFRIYSGQRFSHALSLNAELRAGVVSRADVTRALGELHATLSTLSPAVEPSPEEPGVFWLDVTGLRYLYPDLADWARTVHRTLQHRHGLVATAVVGFSRFATYALAKARSRARGAPVQVLQRSEDERRLLERVSLHDIGLAPATRDALAKLGVTRVGDFLRLPAAGLRERFGEHAHRLHHLASGAAFTPLQASLPEEPAQARVLLDEPETDMTRLLFVLKPRVHELLDALAVRHRALTALTLTLTLDQPPTAGARPTRSEELRPAAPTLELSQLVDLLRVKLESLALPAGVREVALRIQDVEATSEQLRLFTEHPRRNLEAAGRALARLRAELGEDAVVRPRLRDAHLPEAQFAWEPTVSVGVPKARAAATRPLMRRLYTRPVPLPARARRERDDGWLVRGVEGGPAVRVQGPYVVSGGWWKREVQRAYHYVQLQSGEILWVYYDAHRRRWFLQGVVD